MARQYISTDVTKRSRSRQPVFEQEISFAARKGFNALITDDPTAMIAVLQHAVCRAIKADILQFKVTFFI
jgi:hypothetical protein